MPGRRLERLLDAGLTGLVAQELVGKQPSLLVKQVGPPLGDRRPGELQIDELDAQLEVAALAVKPAGVGERLRQHLRVDPGAVARVERRQGLERLAVVGVELQVRERF